MWYGILAECCETEALRYQTTVCHFSCLHVMEEYVLTFHSNNRRNYVCPVCERAFSENGARKRHIEEIHGIGKHRFFRCSCGKTYVSSSGFSMMLLTRNLQSFKRLYSWEKHFRTVHQGEQKITPEPSYRNPGPEEQLDEPLEDMDENVRSGNANARPAAEVSSLRLETDASVLSNISFLPTTGASDSKHKEDITALTTASRRHPSVTQASQSSNAERPKAHPRYASTVEDVVLSRSPSSQSTPRKLRRKLHGDTCHRSPKSPSTTVALDAHEGTEMTDNAIPPIIRRGPETLALSFVLN